ncbi:transposase [Ileibacterium valens]|uniref:transposase n=1 Tax=Ileibacterium valens TaxID=1862668 RepID=UPI001300D655|nr:transposase [Ileibacterium valens]
MFTYRGFFKSYIGWIKNDQENIDNILVDSTGLPNSIHFPLTAVSNHNGKISNEIRLIYVTQEETGIPIYLRYVCGSIPDVLTIPATIKELKEMSVPIKEVLLDAGYYSEKNVIRLYTENVKFVCRVKENLRLFKELVSIHRKEIENQDNLVKFGKRLVFIKARAVNLAPNCPGYAYICLDLARRASESMNMLNHLDPDSGTSDELFEKLASEGTMDKLPYRCL